MSSGHHARDRESTSRRPLVIGLVVLAAVLAALITREAVSSDEAAACTSRPEATIVAAPGLAPALKDVAAAMTEEGRCSRITVQAQESSTVFAQLLATDEDSTTLWVPASDVWRSEERRVGKGGVSTCRSWVVPDHYKTKKN